MDEKTLTRFWAKVNKNGPVVREDLGACWDWVGARSGKGYGRLCVGSLKDGTRRNVDAHRLSWEHFNGEPLGDRVARHRCDRECCVAPHHLVAGTQAENVRDMMERGRHNPTRGERHPKAKITEADVVRIRERAASGERWSDIARDFGLRRHSVHYIAIGKTWPLVGGPRIQFGARGHRLSGA